MNRNLTLSLACLITFVGFLVFSREKLPNTFLKSQAQSKTTGKAVTKHCQKHNHGEEETINHSDPKNQRRMGIFHYNKGNQFLRKGNWKEAVLNYKMALHHDRTLREVYVNLSTAYLQGKNFPDAFKALKDLEKHQPQHPMLHYNMACYHSLTGDTASSLNSLQHAVKLGFKNKQQIQTDPDLKNLRRGTLFQDWIEQLLS